MAAPLSCLAQEQNSSTVVDKQASVAYKLHMADLKQTAEFGKWLKGLRDTKAKAKVLVRVQRLGLGNPGDVKPVGEGVSEMRIDYGPGYRVYYKKIGEVTIVLFGGDKDSQDADTRRAKALAKELEE
jgi:putative addiction module killer protein